MNIGTLARLCIKQGLTNRQTLAIVKHVFPKGATKLHNISWYRSEMSRQEA